ncbi:hypothetical protein IGI37_000164 [Enterococcus sp. AZ194]|uniref:MurR/RpiR family transcriptional regulator n=1 Tax=Enterococcus sp. AZ194 TaxID=2774629 RepID=UPI003F1F3D7B
MEVLPQIRKVYSSLSKANKKIADYMLHFPEEVIKQTASEIGEASNVSPASVVRFVKKIGYVGLDEMKVQLSTDQAILANERQIDPIVSENDSLDVLCGKVETLIKDTATDVFNTVDRDVLAKAINHIKKAQNVFLFGIGASSLIAYDLFHKFSRAGIRSSFIFDIHIGIEMLNYATADDVVIAVTYSGHTKEILLACEYAKKKGAHLIVITRNQGPKIKNLANEVLVVPSNEHLLRVGAISSMYSSMIVGTALYLGVIQENIEEDITENMIITKNWINPLKEE